jgi:hypothetical protein
MPPAASLGAQVAKSSKLSALICNAALRAWGFADKAVGIFMLVH